MPMNQVTIEEVHLREVNLIPDEEVRNEHYSKVRALEREGHGLSR